MAKIINISTDRAIFEEASPVRARQIEYGALFDELHIIVFTRAGQHLPRKMQIAPNVHVYGTNSVSKLFYMRGARYLAASVIRERECTAENTVVTTQDPFETGLVGVALQKKFGLPLHVQIHTDFLSPFFAKESVANWLRVRFARHVLGFANAVRPVSKKIQASLSGLTLNPAVPCGVLPIFVDISKIENTPVTVDLKKKYPQFNFIVLTASRLVASKNVGSAIYIMSRLAGMYPKIGLVVVGSGPAKAGLEKLVHKLDLAKNVVFEDWQPNLNSYYKTANVFLSTSLYEGYGMTLVEAVAAHCPTVSTDVGVASELLQDGVSLVCKVGDEFCLAENISKLVENVSLRAEFTHEVFGRLENVALLDKAEYLRRYKENVLAALAAQK